MPCRADTAFRQDPLGTDTRALPLRVIFSGKYQLAGGRLTGVFFLLRRLLLVLLTGHVALLALASSVRSFECHIEFLSRTGLLSQPVSVGRFQQFLQVGPIAGFPEPLCHDTQLLDADITAAKRYLLGTTDL